MENNCVEINKFDLYINLYDSNFLTYVKHKLNFNPLYNNDICKYLNISFNNETNHLYKRDVINGFYNKFLGYLKVDNQEKNNENEYNKDFEREIFDMYKVFKKTFFKEDNSKIKFLDNSSDMFILENEAVMAIIGVFMKIFSVKLSDSNTLSEEKDYFEWLYSCSIYGKKVLKEDIELSAYYRKIKYELQNLEKDFLVFCTYLSENNINYDDKLSKERFYKDKEKLYKYLSKFGRERIDNINIDFELKNNDIDYEWLMLKINTVSFSINDILLSIIDTSIFKNTLLLKEDVKNTLIRYFDEFTKRRYGNISGFVYYMSIKEDFFSKHLLSIYRYEKK